MRKNQNYTGDFKVKVAQAYLFDHLGGYQSVAEHFGVTNRSQVQHWVKLVKISCSNLSFLTCSR